MTKRRNKYEALCARCNLMVQGGGGFAEMVAGKWVVRHDWCVDLERAGLADSRTIAPQTAERHPEASVSNAAQA